MLSNKLTFSLASFVLLLGIAFVAAPPNADAAVTNFDFATTTSVTVDATKHGFLLLPQEGGTIALAGITTVSFVQNQSLPNTVGDLDIFFQNGGTIRLLGPKGSVAKSLVISEIMWGTDASADTNDVVIAARSQWIEIYNTTGEALTLSRAQSYDHDAEQDSSEQDAWYGYTVQFIPAGDTAKAPTGYRAATGENLSTATATQFTPAEGTDYVVLDEISNNQGYWAPKGQGGRTEPSGNDPVKPLISMYRDINYGDIAKELGEATPNRATIDSKIKNGTRASGWKASERPAVNNEWSASRDTRCPQFYTYKLYGN